jgi:hypothetical protein
LNAADSSRAYATFIRGQVAQGRYSQLRTTNVFRLLGAFKVLNVLVTAVSRGNANQAALMTISVSLDSVDSDGFDCLNTIIDNGQITLSNGIEILYGNQV